jgi:hypothetical protein
MNLDQFIADRKDRLSCECMPKAIKSIHVNIKREIKGLSGVTSAEKKEVLAMMEAHLEKCLRSAS